MKKYYQLILIVTSIISLTLLLVYRHEYNRLRYVLEVFNFFGQPNQCSYPELLNSTSVTQHDWGPIPLWLTLEDSYMYSAFLQSENEVETLVVHDEGKAPIKSCYLWFESKLKTLVGKLKYSKISKLSENNALSLYKYFCNVDSVSEVPYAVSYSNKNKRTRELTKIMLNPLHKIKFHFTTVCVVPSDTYSKASIVEFISYHKIVGVDSFIIYSNNIPYKFLHLLEKLSVRLGIEIVSYPWNYPLPTTPGTRQIIEEDCLLRTKDKSRNIMILDWSEFVVPKHHHTLAAMLDNYDPINRTQRFGLKSLVFCTDNHDHSEPFVLRSLYYDEAKETEPVYIHRNNVLDSNVVINTQEVTPAVAAIHRYISCTTHPGHSSMENAMLRFSTDLRKSTLFKLFKYDRL